MATVLIIGAGPVVGQASAAAFASAGYKVAVASRTQRLDSSKFHFFQFDASDPTKVPALFEKVREAIGVPSVVIYNACAVPESSQLAAIDIDTPEAFAKRMNVNAVSPAVVAHEAVKGFLQLESEGKLGPGGGTYMFTGNVLNERAVPGFLTLGLGKNSSAALIKYLALTSYNDKPFSFYYVDERQPDGNPMLQGPTPEAHADLFLQLSRDPKQGPWQYTFIKESGYKNFAEDSA
ncbi:NAD(P)-binding protein [Xylaria nigripes]|nr:NAD(P)-binding protein [Xylaria nigripes]